MYRPYSDTPMEMPAFAPRAGPPCTGGRVMIRVAMACLATIVFSQIARAESALVARGSYLVNGIMTCGNCHTPKGPKGDIADKAFSGGLEFDERPFKVTAPNNTPDKETGIGAWSDADIKKL